MSFESVDKLQKVLATEVFAHTKDAKKASGRALGTLVEIITFYLLKTWGLSHQISIERGLVEYGNAEISHNIEYSLHPILNKWSIEITAKSNQTLTANVLLKELVKLGVDTRKFQRKNNNLLAKNILRNACVIASSEDTFLIASIDAIELNTLTVDIVEQHIKPYTMFECKRVGVEEGMKKGPQTIEKAKQGAYVARSASSLQKIRTETGDLFGIIYKSDGEHIIKPFLELLEEVIDSNNKELLRRFILTVGVVSNHGNWFTAENQNKELKVLAQSYDWLVFLTDQGLSSFINDLLLKPSEEHRIIKETFLASYSEAKTKNSFTKVQMNIEADRLLINYFKNNLTTIEGWFNVISPANKTLSTLKQELATLKSKKWEDILK